MIVFSDQAGNREDERQLVFVGQGVHMRIRIIDVSTGISTPSRLLSVIGIVDDTNTTVDIGRDGRIRSVIASEVGITLIYGVVAVIQQVGADVVHMLIVILAVVTTSIFLSGDAFCLLEPRGRRSQVALVGDDTLHLGLNLFGSLGRETTNENVVVDVVTDNLAVGVIT